MNKYRFLSVLFILITFFNGCSKKIIPLENTNLKTVCYTDATGDNGNSIIKFEFKSGIRFNYTLNPGFGYPYAGISIAPDSGLLDLHKYKYIDMLISADTSCAINVYLKTIEDSCTIPGNYLTYRFLEYTIHIDSSPRVYRIDIASMKTPQWWYSVNKLEHELGKPDLRRVNNFDIATSSIYLQRPGFIQVEKMVLVKDNLPFLIAILILLTSVLIIGITVLLLNKKKKHKGIISYQEQKNKGILDTEVERILAYMGNYYADSSLSTETVAKETGVHWARVSSIVKKEHSLSFKQYLNTIRIAEAKRLLIETKRQVLDIGLSVGYGNISHFNRVFKEYQKCSPREFRNENCNK